MKAFLIILTILVVLAGVVFYFGWIQILLPPDTYAVLFTKTGGYDKQVVRPGEFTWRWDRLIPTNMTVYTFDLHPYSTRLSFKGSLPSAELYSSILPDNPDFTVSGEVNLEFSIKPERLPTLVADEKLTPDGLDKYLEQKADAISKEVMDRLTELTGESLPGQELNSRLKQAIDPLFPDLSILTLSTTAARVPDLQLYELAKQSYRDLVETRDRAREEAVARTAGEQVRAENLREREKAVLESLREYGKLLNEYPVLLKALYVQKLSGEKLATIPEFDLSKILETTEDQ
jgi:hypothetical protein